MGMETKEEDYVVDLFVTCSHDYIMFFTNKGRVYWLKAYRIPVGGRHAKGKPIVNLLEHLEDGEHVMSTIPVKLFDEDAVPGVRHQEGRDQEDQAHRLLPCAAEWASSPSRSMTATRSSRRR